MQAGNGVVIVEILWPKVTGVNPEGPALMLLWVTKGAGDVLHFIRFALCYLFNALLLLTQPGILLVNVNVLVGDALHEFVVEDLSRTACLSEVVVT